MDYETTVRGMYAAFNARDIDAAVAMMATDVDWPNGWEGGYVKGRDEVRAYRTRQWAELDSSAQPLEVTERPDGQVQVRVHLVGRDPAGAVQFDHEGLHVYTFRDGLVTRMTIEAPA